MLQLDRGLEYQMQILNLGFEAQSELWHEEKARGRIDCVVCDRRQEFTAYLSILNPSYDRVSFDFRPFSVYHIPHTIHDEFHLDLVTFVEIV